MKITIAGYNVDVAQIEQAKSALPTEPTPEIISASYARISRDPRPIDEIRKDAREQVARARQSNEQIVFGVGHSSIAEHAVYNIDVLGVSRFIIEEIQQSRLVSYTEKSQRYISLTDDYVVPAEIEKAGCRADFEAIIAKQNALYHEMYGLLVPLVTEKYRNTIFDKKSVLEGLAKEDARYCVALATQAQMGMTINARNVESMLMRMFSSPFDEGRRFAQQLYDRIIGITPSLVKYVEPTLFHRKSRDEFRKYASQYLTPDAASDDVKLVRYTQNGDDMVLAGIVFSTSNVTLSRALSLVRTMAPAERERLMRSVFIHMQAHDSALREFENVEYVFEMEMSASCYAQMKRHRMATILTQPYDASLGVVMPEVFKQIDKVDAFESLIAATEKMYTKLYKKIGDAAAYVLTNAHKRRVVMRVNAREMYHLARLRVDVHAQWDIRNVVSRMVECAREVTPLTLMMCTGKSGFEEMKDALFQ